MLLWCVMYFVCQQSQECVLETMLEYQCQECVLRCVSMTVTVPKIRNAAAMDVDISVWFHIKVFISYVSVLY